MLKKLIRHELRANVRVLSITYAAILFLAMVAYGVHVFIQIPFYSVLSNAVLALAGLAGLIITQGMLIIRFYKGLFGNEGYFWMMLPASPGKIYFSRILTGLIWGTFSTLLAIGAYLLSYWSVSQTLVMEISDLGGQIFHEIFTPGVWLFLALQLIFSQAMFLVSVYFSITVSNVRPFQGLGIGAAVLCYALYYVVSQILRMVFGLFIPLSIQFFPGEGWSIQMVSMYQTFEILVTGQMNNSTSFPIGLGGTVIDIVLFGLLIFLTLRMLHRKINIR